MQKSEETPIVRKKYRYVCPACTGTAIETTNKMLGTVVDCSNCGKRITLDSEQSYIKI